MNIVLLDFLTKIFIDAGERDRGEVAEAVRTQDPGHMS